MLFAIAGGKEETMRRFAIFFVIAIILTSCSATLQGSKSKRLDEVKADLNCIEYKEGMDWEQVKKIGEPDIYPLPEPDTASTGLSKNTRVYKNMTLIFYTETKEVKEEEKVRFREVVTKIEVCKEK